MTDAATERTVLEEGTLVSGERNILPLLPARFVEFLGGCQG